MKKMIKKTAATIAAAAMLFSGTVISAGAANASNAETPDVPVSPMSDSGGISPYSATDSRINQSITKIFQGIYDSYLLPSKTYFRSKDDYTSVYIFITSTLNDVTPLHAKVYGSNSGSWTKNETLNALGNHVDFVRVNLNEQSVILNNVKEDSYRYAGLQMRYPKGTTTAMGYWSSDSVNTSGMHVCS